MQDGSFRPKELFQFMYPCLFARNHACPKMFFSTIFLARTRSQWTLWLLSIGKIDSWEHVVLIHFCPNLGHHLVPFLPCGHFSLILPIPCFWFCRVLFSFCILFIFFRPSFSISLRPSWSSILSFFLLATLHFRQSSFGMSFVFRRDPSEHAYDLFLCPIVRILFIFSVPNVPIPCVIPWSFTGVLWVFANSPHFLFLLHRFGVPLCSTSP